MIYGHSPRASVAGSALKRAMARASGTWGGTAWRPLDADSRFALVENALKCANDDCADGFPIAL